MKTISLLPLILSSVLGTSLAFADLNLPELETIHANYICEEDNGGSLQVAINTIDNKIWVSDVGSTEGLPASQVEIRLARCPGCMVISGLHGGMIPFEGSMNKFKLTFVVEQADTAQSLSCKTQPLN